MKPADSIASGLRRERPVALGALSMNCFLVRRRSSTGARRTDSRKPHWRVDAGTRGRHDGDEPSSRRPAYQPISRRRTAAHLQAGWRGPDAGSGFNRATQTYRFSPRPSARPLIGCRDPNASTRPVPSSEGAPLLSIHSPSPALARMVRRVRRSCTNTSQTRLMSR